MFVCIRRGDTFALTSLHLEMKYRIHLAIAITFFFGIATYILLRKVYSENAQVDKGIVDRVVDSPDNKLQYPDSSAQKNQVRLF